MSEHICDVCHRPLAEDHTPTRTHRPIVKIRAVHGGYGCDSGCCGFRFFGYTEPDAHEDAAGAVGAIRLAAFTFTHGRDALEATLARLSDHFQCRDVAIVTDDCGLY